MDRITLARSIRSPGSTIELDLQNPQQREWLLSLYGGEEMIRQRLPALHQTYAATLQDPPPPLARGGDFVSGAEVEGVHWQRNGNQLSVRAVTSLPETALFIDEYLEIRTSAGESVDGCAQSASDSHHTVLTLDTEFDPAKFKSDILEIDYTATWCEADTGRLRALMSSRDVHRQVYLNSAVKEVHLEAPVKRAGTEYPINIAYNRDFLPSEEVDYRYQSSFNPSTGKQRLFAPLSAWVEFQEGTEEQFDNIDITTFVLKMDCKHGLSTYTKTGREKPIEKHFVAQPDAEGTHPNGFSFSLNPEWMDDVPSRRWPIRDRVDFFFAVNFKLKSGREGTIQIGSDLSEAAKKDSGSAVAGWLNLVWGCLAPGTRILMADGTERPIEQIKAGDVVRMDAQGNRAVVDKAVGGNEPRSMVNIQMLGGRTLVCTQDHPIVTDRGTMKAVDVHGNCRLCTPDGGHVTIIGIWDTPGGEIYNLVLRPEGAQRPPEGGCTMFAERVLVGDNGMQGALGIVQEEPFTVNPHREETAQKRALWEEILT